MKGALVRCPNCHDSTDVDDNTELANFSCPSCGSKFSLLGEETVPFEQPGLNTIGHFELVDQLGAGTFGSVWMARDTQLDRIVAVKIPRKGQLDPTEAEQFIREARAAAQLKHPNIVAVHEVGRQNSQVYIVSDYIEGLTLADWFVGQQPTFRSAAELCVKLAEALHHAHEAGVVHRDLKPSNIILDRDNEPHIMDFGLAKREAADVTMTMEGKVLGTPAYMSPEQAKGEAHQADRRSDVYSLGVILYELLTGHKPFRGNVRMLLQQVISEDAPSPRRLNSNVPRDLETICLKCLEKDPCNRYQSGSHLAEELGRFLRGEPIESRPITTVARGWRWCARNPLLAGLVIAVGGLLLFLAIAGPLVAISQASLARKTRRHLYTSDMNVAMQAWDFASVDRVLELLKRHEPQPNQEDLRGFEWYYLSRLSARSLRAPTLKQGSSVRAVTFSRDGGYLASLGRQNSLGVSELKLWSLATHEPERSIEFGSTPVTAGAFSPDAETIALGTRDGKVELWNLVTGNKRGTLNGHDSPILFLAFSPAGEALASLSGDNELKLWDLADERQLWSVTSTNNPYMARGGVLGWTMSLAFSPNGEMLAVGSADGAVTLCDAAMGEILRGLSGHADEVNAVTFSIDGAALASGGEGTNVILWDVDSGEMKHIWEDHKNSVTSLAFSPDGETIASGGRDNVVNRWDISTGRKLPTLKGHAGWVTTATYSPGGKQLVSGSSDQTLKVWDLSARAAPQVLDGHTDSVWAVAFSPDRKRLASAGQDRQIKLWDLTTGKELHTFEGHQANVFSVVFSPDGKTLASGGWDGTVKLWTVDGRPKESLTLAEDLERVYRVALSADCKLLAAGCADGTVRLWDLTTRKQLKTFQGHAEEVYFVAFAPDGGTLASGSWDGTVRLWDLQTGQEQRTSSPGGLVFAVAFAPDGGTLAYGSDNTVRLWNLKTEEERTLAGHGSWVTSVAYSTDGKTLASAGSSNMVKIWDVAEGEERITLKGHTRGVGCGAFSPDGRTLASSGRDYAIRLWHASSD